MPRNTSTLVLSPWSGGLNSAQDPISLGVSNQQALTVADNIVFTTIPSRKKRGGQARFNSATQMTDGSTASSAVDGLFATTFWWRSSATTKTEELVVVAEDSRMRYGTSYGTLNVLTYSGVSPTFSHGQISADAMGEYLFVGYSKAAPPLTYTGAGANVLSASASTLTVGTFPNGYLVRQHASRMWVAGDGTNPDRLYYSASSLPFAYGTAGGYVDINPGDGDPKGITAIFPSVNVSELYIAKREAIYKLITSDPSPTNWPLIRVTNGVGCIQHNSAVAVDQGDVIFASDRGIHSLQQVLTTVAVIEGQFLSAPIQTDYNDGANKNLISAIWAPTLNSYLFSFQREGQTTIETVYGYNIVLGAWFRWTSVPANHLFRRLNISTGLYEYYSCGDGSTSSDKGYINKLQQDNLWDFSSSTGNINTIIKTPLLYPEGNFLNERNWLNLSLLLRSRDSSPINVSWIIDEITTNSDIFYQRIVGGNTLGTTTLGTAFILGAGAGAKPIMMHLNGAGNAIELMLQHNTIGKDIEVYGLAVEYQDAGESEDAYRSFPAS